MFHAGRQISTRARRTGKCIKIVRGRTRRHELPSAGLVGRHRRQAVDVLQPMPRGGACDVCARGAAGHPVIEPRASGRQRRTEPGERGTTITPPDRDARSAPRHPWTREKTAEIAQPLTSAGVKALPSRATQMPVAAPADGGQQPESTRPDCHGGHKMNAPVRTCLRVAGVKPPADSAIVIDGDARDGMPSGSRAALVSPAAHDEPHPAAPASARRSSRRARRTRRASTIHHSVRDALVHR